MQVQNKKNGYILLAIAAVLVILGIAALFAWGSGNKAAPTATLSVNDIYTQVAQTVVAQQTTQQALNPPTTTPFPTFPLASPTAATQAPIPTTIGLSPVATAASCDNSAFVIDVTIPDNTVMTPGQTFVKTWAMQNTGTCTWNTNYKLAFVSGDAMSGTNTAMTGSVAPGQQTNISVNLTAPAQSGSFKGYWRMTNANGVSFGDSPWVLITVSSTTATGTAGTPAATNTSTTPTITNTPPPPTATTQPAP